MADNPRFWIDVVRTQAHTTDCREKTLALTNAADAFKRIIETLFAERDRAADRIGALLHEKHALQSALSESRAECERLTAENASLRNQMVMRFADMSGVQRGIQNYDNDCVAVIERHDFCSQQFRNVWIVPAGSSPQPGAEMNTTATGVFAELDDLIESLRGSADAEYSTDSASPTPNADMKKLVALTAIRTRIAALVEAGKKLDADLLAAAYDGGCECDICGSREALSTAIKGLEQ